MNTIKLCCAERTVQIIFQVKLNQNGYTQKQLKMDRELELTFSGYFGEKGIYFQGDVVSGTLDFENQQHKSITGKGVCIT